MAEPEFRIFLSAVSSEFRSARNELTDDFRARDVLVRVRWHASLPIGSASSWHS